VRKANLFDHEQIPRQRRKADESNVLQFKPDALDDDQKAAVAAGTAAQKRKRYDLMADHECIATVILRRARRPDGTGGGFKLEDGTLELVTSKGAMWIDARLVLEGKHRNRWVHPRFMFQGASSTALKAVQETREQVRRAKSYADDDLNGIPDVLAMLDGLRVAVAVRQEPHWQHGDLVNTASIISCQPGTDSWHLYEKIARRRKVEKVKDADGQESLLIDMPGWDRFPFSPIAKLYQDRLAEYNARRQRNSIRAVEKMERKAR